MKGRCDRDPSGLDPVLPQSFLELLDVLGGAGQHDLLRTVVIRNGDIGRQSSEELPYLLDGPADDDHGARNCGSLCHQLAPFAGDAQHVGVREHTGGMKRRDLAEAVAGREIGLKPQLFDESQHGKGGAADGGLCPLGRLQAALVLFGLVIGKSGAWEHDLMEGYIRVEIMICGPVPWRPGPVESHGQIGPHADVLAPLSGKEECNAALVGADAVAAPVRKDEGRIRVLVDS